MQDYPYLAYETYIATSNGYCKDGFWDDKTTCGFAYDTNGDKLPHSQGFCCDCPFWSLFDPDDTPMRATTCQFMGWSQITSTAHCLKFFDLWYSAFRVSQARLNYEIGIKIGEKDTQILDSMT